MSSLLALDIMIWVGFAKSINITSKASRSGYAVWNEDIRCIFLFFLNAQYVLASLHSCLKVSWT